MTSFLMTVTAVLACCCFLTSCGKVTQQSSDRADAVYFDLVYEVSVWSSPDVILPSSPSYNITPFSLGTGEMWAWVGGMDARGNLTTLSGGKAILTGLPKGLPTDQNGKKEKSMMTEIRSLAFRTDGVELDQADYRWSKLSFDSAQMKWRAASPKIEQGYPVYMVAVYSSKDAVRLRLLPAFKANHDPSRQELGVISDYETFISCLFLNQWMRRPSVVADETALFELRSMYTMPFYKALARPLPVNTVKVFHPAEPVFLMDDPLYESLWKLYEWSRVDVTEGERFLESIRPGLPRDAYDILRKYLNEKRSEG